MLFLAILAASLVASNAIVCFHGICDDIKKPDPLQCAGTVIKNGGFCGCYDVCAKQEGEECTAESIRGMMPRGTCDQGLTCVRQPNMIIGAGKCVKDSPQQEMLFLAILAASLVASNAIVCFHGICDDIKKPDPLQCAGTVIKNGGFCGCYDVCAKQEGEECTAESIRGMMPRGTCDQGLTCVRQPNMIIGAGKCVKDSPQQARATQTLCQQRRIQSMIIMVVYKGQWTPRCDAQGQFMPEQCDNTGSCFCVDVLTGVVDKSTKVLGSANCTPP